MSLLDDIGDQVSSAWNDVTSAGVPAVISGVEAYAGQQLNQAAGQSQAQATAAAQVIASRPPATGLMASIQQAFGSVATTAFLKQYGLYIAVGGLGLYILIKKI